MTGSSKFLIRESHLAFRCSFLAANNDSRRRTPNLFECCALFQPSSLIMMESQSSFNLWIFLFGGGSGKTPCPP